MNVEFGQDEATLARKTDAELGRRSRTSAMLYFVLGMMVVAATPFGTDFPAVVYTICGALLFLGVGLLVLGRGVAHFQPERQRLWRRLFLVTNLALAAAWSMLACLSLVAYGLRWSSMLALLGTAAICAGGSMALSPAPSLFRAWIAVMILPQLAMLFAHGGSQGYALSAMFTLHLGYLWYEGRELHVEYRDLLTGTLALERRQQELESEIDRRERLEADMRRKERALDGLIHTIHGIVWEGDPRTMQFTFVSRKAESILGYPAEDWLEPDFWPRHIHPDDREQTLEHGTRLAAQGKDHEIDYRMIHRNGRVVWLRDFVTVQVDDGEPVRLRGVMVDITAQKRAERRLQASENRMRDLIEHAPVCIHEVDTDGRLLSMNRAGLRMMGAQSETEVVGMPYLDAVSAADRERIGGLLEGALRGRPAQFEFTSAGQRSVFRSSFIPMREENGRAGKLMGVTEDVTEQARARDALVEATRTAQEASRLKSEFLANMSHEIRTPMNGVLGITELLLDTGLDEAQAEHVRTIRDSGRALVAIINDILDFSKIESGKLTMESLPFDVRDAMSVALRPLAVLAQEKGIGFSWSVGPGVPPRIVGDEVRVRQVLINLAANAIKFTPEGEVEVAVHRVSGSGDEIVLEFEVRDTGIGIPADVQRRIFSAFQQADGSTTRRFGGTGLGLTISAELVGMMGGELKVDSAEGCGSRFHWRMRVAAADSAEEPVAEQADGDEGSGRGLRILLAEDNAVNRLVASRLLQRMGHEVTAVENGQLALDTLRDEAFDLVLMDVQMPVKDGLQTVTELRDLEAATGSRTPVIALTAHALVEDRTRCLAAGMDAYLAKPIDVDELRSKIRALVA